MGAGLRSPFGVIAGVIALGVLIASVGCGKSRRRFPDGASDGGQRDSRTNLPDLGMDEVDAERPERDANVTLPDSGPRRDSGPIGGCSIGQACTPDRGCASGVCQAEIAFEIGGAADPIRSLPGGGSLPGAYFPGGYCAPEVIGEGVCDPDDPDGDRAACGTCGSCVDFGDDLAMCMQSCTPSGTSSGCARDGYTCDLGLDVCIWGCQSDAVCRVYREDTNRNGQDDSDPATGLPIDQLVYDTLSDAYCNPNTYRCTHTGTVGASAGSQCTRDKQCEADGECFTQHGNGWPGGYCIKRGCELPGRQCAGSGTCIQFGEQALCVVGCKVGLEANTPSAWLGVNGHGNGCRTGYQCTWDGASSGSATINGACFPGNYNSITVDNLGGACGTSASTNADNECYSPGGRGLCLLPSVWANPPPRGMCIRSGCEAPGLPANFCGTSAGIANRCVDLAGDPNNPFYACVASCRTNTDCQLGYSCYDDDGSSATPSFCLPL